MPHHQCFIQNLLYTWHLRNSPSGTPRSIVKINLVVLNVLFVWWNSTTIASSASLPHVTMFTIQIVSIYGSNHTRHAPCVRKPRLARGAKEKVTIYIIGEQ
ncbi:hypothetical protein H5410_052751 [Solanum commersonii]|uniref:Uncharacterized protein n=1 Tax=Solanum commersonii TaxID=4109 RepID=A0A9J5X4A3_SOLCO|nr:hypothetical protein H5410_052751 [Solanum commersonii]